MKHFNGGRVLKNNQYNPKLKYFNVLSSVRSSKHQIDYSISVIEFLTFSRPIQ